MATTSDDNIPKIVVVGGGAGGLELATKLGRKLVTSPRLSLSIVLILIFGSRYYMKLPREP